MYTFGYDPAGHINRITDPLARGESVTYDALDRILSLTLPDPGTGASGFRYHWGYAAQPTDGTFTSTTMDFNGVNTTLYVDVWGHAAKLVNGVNNTTQLTWSDGLPVEISDAEGNTTTYSYDALRRLQKIRHPEGTFMIYGYTPTGQVATREDRKHQILGFGYDELGRLTSRQYPEGTIGYVYDGPMISSVHDNAEGGGEKTSSYVYDQDFRLTQVTNDRGVLNYSWLPGDSLEGYQVDGSAWINYSYYPSGDLHTIQRQGDANPFEYTYLLSGARAALQMSNGSRVAYTWDSLSRILTLTNLDPTGALISHYSYQYDQDW